MGGAVALTANRQHIRASGLGRVCQETCHGPSPPLRSRACPHPGPSTDSRVGSGVNTGPSTDKPPNGGFPFYLKLQTVSTLWGMLLATQGVKSVSQKHSLHSRFVLNERAAQPEDPGVLVPQTVLPVPGSDGQRRSGSREEGGDARGTHTGPQPSKAGKAVVRGSRAFSGHAGAGQLLASVPELSLLLLGQVATEP